MLAFATREYLALELANKIDDDSIALATFAINNFPRRFLLAKTAKHCVDVVVTDGNFGFVDFDFLEILELELRHDFKRCRKRKSLAVLGLGFDLRPTCRTQFFLRDSCRETFLQDVAQHFLANLLAKALLDNLRGHLAGAKSLDLGGTTDRLEARIHLLLDGFDWQLHAHAALQSTDRFDGDVHSINSLVISYLQLK